MAIPEKSSLIYPTQDKMAVFGHIMAKFGQIWVYFLVRPRHESPSATNIVFVLGVLVGVGVVVIRFSIP